MFARNYFPNRYFAPRYWPKFGSNNPSRGISIPARRDNSISIPGRRNVALSIPARRNVAISIPGRRNVAVSIPARRNVALSIPGRTSMSVSRDIEFHRGEDVVLTVTMASTTNITGWAITFSVKKHPDDPTSAVITKTVGSGITLTDTTNGVFTVTIASADTANLAVREYHYDIKRTDSGAKTVLTVGSLTLLAPTGA